MFVTPGNENKDLGSKAVGIRFIVAQHSSTDLKERPHSNQQGDFSKKKKQADVVSPSADSKDSAIAHSKPRDAPSKPRENIEKQKPENRKEHVKEEQNPPSGAADDENLHTGIGAIKNQIRLLLTDKQFREESQTQLKEILAQQGAFFQGTLKRIGNLEPVIYTGEFARKFVVNTGRRVYRTIFGGESGPTK